MKNITKEFWIVIILVVIAGALLNDGNTQSGHVNYKNVKCE